MATLSEAAQAPQTRNGAGTLTALCIGVYLVNFDISATSLALPAIQRDLGGGLSDLQWVIDAYILAMTCLLLSAGALSDRLGKNATLLVSLAGFGLASAACAVAPSIAALIAGRAAQGVFAALLVPTAIATMSELWPEPKARAKAIGAGAAIGGLALASGPVLAGALLQWGGWPTIFWINLPLIVASGLALLILLPKRAVPEPRPLKPLAQGLLIVALSGLSFLLIEAPRHSGLTPTMGGVLGATFAVALAFLVVEARSHDPLIPPALLRDRVVLACALVNLAMQFGTFSVLFLMSLRFQGVDGLTPSQAGLRFLYLTIPLALVSQLAPVIAARTSFRAVIGGGSFLVAAALAGLWLLPGGQQAWFAVLGLGLAAVTSPTSMAILWAAPPALAATAAGLLNAFRQFGSLLGVAFAGVILIWQARLAAGAAALPDGAAGAREELASAIAAGRADRVLHFGAARDAIGGAFAASSGIVLMAATVAAAVMCAWVALALAPRKDLA